ncbi:hypothetical protein HYPSUDRAFT_836777 [Hypholoma sublateritium FD-334 SS-4]|uniref:Uncharacterized protein n=1 Tax=Hypholoma sublateritium (strain FD-334 SS-4) TaxID=945553 RepID=A0A0D2PJ95_HYPSF|nr:hypothetical protein HYPSUDRAFT_836777 [Hypholoma sublateritium FD-334 SS-4]
MRTSTAISDRRPLVRVHLDTLNAKPPASHAVVRRHTYLGCHIKCPWTLFNTRHGLRAVALATEQHLASAHIARVLSAQRSLQVGPWTRVFIKLADFCLRGQGTATATPPRTRTFAGIHTYIGRHANIQWPKILRPSSVYLSAPRLSSHNVIFLLLRMYVLVRLNRTSLIAQETYYARRKWPPSSDLTPVPICTAYLRSVRFDFALWICLPGGYFLPKQVQSPSNTCCHF